VQAERPSYHAGATAWWSEVISRTAVGAGADPGAVERHLGTIVPRLMKRFSSREGYRLFDDTLETRMSFSLSTNMTNRFHACDSSYASCDGRADRSYHKFGCTNRCGVYALVGYVLKAQIVDVLEDLGISRYLSPVLISEVERVEKPSMSIFLAACVRGDATPPETVHVGDDFRE
jgi:hypothetical protein